MLDSSVIWIALGGLALSVAIERLLVPCPSLRRPLASWLLHGGAWCFALGALYLLTGRGLFSAINVLAAWLLIVLVSNSKYHSLREPFVCADFEYFSDAVRFPRLYLPFFGIGKAIGLAVVFIVYLGAGLYFEPRDSLALSTSAWLLAIGAGLLVVGHRSNVTATFEASEDLRRWGLVACLWRYFVAARVPVDRATLESPFAQPLPAVDSAQLPDMVSVQSESFFDVRRLYPGVKPQVLTHFDQLRGEALAQGRLQVAAWGANTVRTEFAYLSGVAGTQLGVHRFNPYRLLARNGVPSIAAALKRQGYRTVCIHPYARSFYGRDKVLPALGFDEFIDVSAFNESDKAGPFIGDCAVAAKILQRLQAQPRTQPLFIHAITMENHGPLHLEQVNEADLPTWFDSPPAAELRDLGPYVRHIANADRMLGQLHKTLTESARPTSLCFFGDHVPILPDVYKALGEPDGDTDYFIWSNWAQAQCLSQPLTVDVLASTFIKLSQTVGLPHARQVRCA
ncbi:LTA synthase family protein [Pseudomonas sp. TMW 2.1634]|uniref:LTA synthase family protein n=1 Tax=Pseudomonas sp. TMW 2.1634 TaxID=1886807 RepID=UPI000E7556D8|nr:LTA synthase family protein [Pseudomonas sp. TMW 2.1634]AOA09175.1 sulfatase [Pseudomonas sp. TMW 2.1634]